MLNVATKLLAQPHKKRMLYYHRQKTRNKIGASVTERELRSRLYGNRGAQIMALQGINDAKHWRDRAAQMRVLSDVMEDPEAQRMMLKLANDYDTIADRAEDRTERGMPGPSPIPKGT